MMNVGRGMSKRLRSTMEARHLRVMPAVFSAISARIAQRAGWDASMFPKATHAMLEEAGVHTVLCGHDALAEASRGMWDYLEAFRREDIAVERRVTEELAGHPLGNFHTVPGTHRGWAHSSATKRVRRTVGEDSGTPFGDFGLSGIGREAGLFGVKEFVEPRSIRI